MPDSIAIIGAGPGLGRAVARRYAREGYEIALIARRRPPLDELVSELAGEGAITHAVTGDLSDAEAMPGLVDAIRAEIGDPDVIYYSAPMRGDVPVTELTSEDLRQLMGISLYALVDLVHAFLAPSRISRRPPTSAGS